MSVRYRKHNSRSSRIMLGSSVALILFFMGLVGYSVVDQTRRSMQAENGKLSYKDAFLEHVTVKDFLQKQGLLPGDEVCIIGSPPVNWARMAGVRIVAEVPDTDQMLLASSEQKDSFLSILRNQGIKAIVVKDGRFHNVSDHNWKPVSGTRDYFVQTLYSAKGA